MYSNSYLDVFIQVLTFWNPTDKVTLHVSVQMGTD